MYIIVRVINYKFTGKCLHRIVHAFQVNFPCRLVSLWDISNFISAVWWEIAISRVTAVISNKSRARSFPHNDATHLPRRHNALINSCVEITGLGTIPKIYVNIIAKTRNKDQIDGTSSSLKQDRRSVIIAICYFWSPIQAKCFLNYHRVQIVQESWYIAQSINSTKLNQHTIKSATDPSRYTTIASPYVSLSLNKFRDACLHGVVDLIVVSNEFFRPLSFH